MSIAGVDIGGTSVKMGLLREGEGLVWQKKIPSVVEIGRASCRERV